MDQTPWAVWLPANRSLKEEVSLSKSVFFSTCPNYGAGWKGDSKQACVGERTLEESKFLVIAVIESCHWPWWSI